MDPYDSPLRSPMVVPGNPIPPLPTKNQSVIGGGRSGNCRAPTKPQLLTQLRSRFPGF